MKFTNKIFFNFLFLLSSVAILTNCDWLKNAGCKDCPSHSRHASKSVDANLSGETLLSINNKSVITADSFEEYWNMLIGEDPNAAAIASLYPNVKADVFKNRLVPSQVILHWMHETKKSETPAFKQKLKAMVEMIEAQLAEQALQEEIVNSIDSSDEILNKFYEENKATNPVFAQAPFVSEPSGIKAETVKFTTEKSAQEFADKAKKAGANLNSLAKEAKKEVNNLGIVSNQSRIDFALKNKIESMEPNSVDVVSTGKNAFEVVKTGSKQEGKWAPFEEVKSSVKQAYIQVKGTENFAKKIDELKKQYNVVENTEFFEKEKASKQAEMEEQLKAMKKQEDAQNPESEPTKETPETESELTK